MANTAEIHIKLTGTNSSTIQKRAVALDKLSASVARLSTVAKQFPSVSTQANNFARGINTAGKSTEKMGKKVQSAGNHLDNFGNLFSRMVRIMAAFAIITTVTRAFTELVSVLVKAPAQFELWNTQLRTLSGNATLASERMQLLQDVAIETPLELPDLFQGLTTLQAFNVEISDRTLPLIADLAAISGRTFQEISEVVGKVIQGSAQAITRSLPTIGIDPKAFKELAEELGSRAEALFQITEERFKDFAKESALTTLGIVSNIKDAFTVIAAEAGTGLLVAFRPVVKEVFNFLEALRSDPQALREFQERLFDIGRGLKRVGEFAVDAGRGIVEFYEAVQRVSQPIGGLKTLLSGLVGLKVAQFLVRAGKGVVGMAGALRLANPWVLAVTTGLTLGVGAYTRYKIAVNDARLRTEEMTAANALLAESWRTVNNAMREGINAIDAIATDALAAQIMAQASSLADIELTPAQLQTRIQGLLGVLEEVGVTVPDLEEALVAVSKRSADWTHKVAEASEALLELAMDFALAAREGRIAAEVFAAATPPSLGVVGASTAETIEADIETFRAFFEFLKLRRENDLISTREYTDAIASLMSILPREIRAAFDKEGLSTATRVSVITTLDTLLDEVRGAQLELMATTEALVSTAQRAIPRPAEAITAASRESIMRTVRATQAMFAREIGTEFKGARVDFELGDLDTAGFNRIKEQLISRIDDILAATDDQEFILELKELKLDIEGTANNLGDALSNAIVQSLSQGADALAEAFGLLITPLQDSSVTDTLKAALAGVLSSIGDALIQTGIAAKAFQQILANITSPAAAAAAIAAGIALKAYANSLSNQIANSASATTGAISTVGTSSAIPTGPIDFGTIAPQQSSVVNLNINTIDAAGVAQFVQDNADELGKSVVYVANRDRATSGEAFGVFTPAFGG